MFGEECLCVNRRKKKEISVAKLRYRFEVPMIIIGLFYCFRIGVSCLIDIE